MEMIEIEKKRVERAFLAMYLCNASCKPVYSDSKKVKRHREQDGITNNSIVWTDSSFFFNIFSFIIIKNLLRIIIKCKKNFLEKNLNCLVLHIIYFAYYLLIFVVKSYFLLFVRKTQFSFLFSSEK
jgi:hypothetical protein